MAAMDAAMNMVKSAWRSEGPRPSYADIAWGVEESWYKLCLGWMLAWTVVLCAGGGRTDKNSIYRLHFVHGIVGPVLSVMTLFNAASFELTMACTLAYFFIDAINMIINDFIVPVGGYQKPMNRLIEYVHHVIVVGSGVCCLLVGDSACVVDEVGPGFGWDAGPRAFNPFIPLIINEASTPFLIVYRVRRGPIIGPLFAIVFFLLRIVLNTSYFVPLLYNSCNHAVIWWPQAAPFFLIQWVFFFQIIEAVMRPKKKEKKEQE